jgi:hypothetical protein
MASPKIGTPFHSFPLTVSLPFALVGGSQRIGGGPVNHELPNKKFVDVH